MAKEKKIRRKRCPWCLYKVEGLRAHIEDRHFPRHCSVCLKTMASHPQTKGSPTSTIVCQGGAFVV